MDTNEIVFCRALAEQHCNRGDSDCRWYHGNWHLLKSLGIVSTSSVHERSLERLLKIAIGDKSNLRILLAGSTDETLLRIVHSACRALSVDAAITGLDICATPLAFMQAYADRNEVRFETVQADIISFDSDQRFDMIVTHAFMGNFDDDLRPVLVSKWRDLLNDEGNIVTIQRVRESDSPPVVKFSQQQATEFVATAVNAAERLGLAEKTTAEVKEIASIFAQQFSTCAIRSKSSLENLFIDAGLTPHCLEYHRLAQQENLSGPSVPSSGEYAHIVAGNCIERT